MQLHIATRFTKHLKTVQKSTLPCQQKCIDIHFVSLLLQSLLPFQKSHSSCTIRWGLVVATPRPSKICMRPCLGLAVLRPPQSCRRHCRWPWWVTPLEDTWQHGWDCRKLPKRQCFQRLELAKCEFSDLLCSFVLFLLFSFFGKVWLQVSSWNWNLHIHKLNDTYWGSSFVWLMFCAGDFCKSYEIIRNYGTCRSSFSMLEKETLAVTSSLLQVLLVKSSAKYRAIWSYQT